MKICAAQLNPTVGAIQSNTQAIIASIAEAKSQGCALILFPELAVCGYPPEDLLLIEGFAGSCDKAVQQITEASSGIAIVVGTVRDHHGLRNSAAIIEDGKLLGYQDKRLLPTYDVFDEDRYFEPGRESKVWPLCGRQVGVTICEDIWRDDDRHVFARYQADPVADLATLKPDLLLNLSSSPYSYRKRDVRTDVVCRAAKACQCPTLSCNQVGGNDSLIFDGNSLALNSDGLVVAQAKSFAVDHLVVDTDNLPTPINDLSDDVADLYSALVLGLRDYFYKCGFKTACLGLSGGIDSALVACIAADALGPENILGLMMPSRYSSEGSLADGRQLAKNLDIHTKTIDIDPLFESYNQALDLKPPSLTCENLQARIRGMILMAHSNQHGYIVLATGNKSEMAMGYATLYGDMCGGLSVINDLTKTMVYKLCRHLEPRIPENILTKPPSAELAPDQKDSDTLPDYAIVDAVLEAYVEQHLSPTHIATTYNLPLPLVTDLISRIHRNEYKRRQAPPGLRVTEKAFSAGRRFPIVQKWT